MTLPDDIKTWIKMIQKDLEIMQTKNIENEGSREVS